MTHQNKTTANLIAEVRNGRFTETETELAERLGDAMDEIERLVAELRRQTKEVASDTGG